MRRSDPCRYPDKVATPAPDYNLPQFEAVLMLWGAFSGLIASDIGPDPYRMALRPPIIRRTTNAPVFRASAIVCAIVRDLYSRGSLTGSLSECGLPSFRLGHWLIYVRTFVFRTVVYSTLHCESSLSSRDADIESNSLQK